MLNVMVVDDEERIRIGIEKILSKYPGELHIAGSYSNGLEALVGMSEMKQGELDVIITDIEMPVMDGLKFIEQAKFKMPETFIIVLSGYNDFEYARQSLRGGAADYLLKPMDKSEVFRLLGLCEQKKQAARGDSDKRIPSPGYAASGIENGAVEQIKRLIEKEYNRNLELKYIAQKVGFNASYLSKIFSLGTGETITDYINRVRIDKAKQFLLDHPGLKVYEIAHLAGYGDKIYFQKLFKKMTGLTPREFRDHDVLPDEGE
ncbi:response regulator [Paenibacillus sepulcri]|uniref:Response regulator n=1 Tax=Paenibacillus sepulcri TaxID=359917 RepID=A0ABS7BXK7_9BACL|nr:response regulator [Paenibacillus sepulcri]